MKMDDTVEVEQHSTPTNVGVFIDYENVYNALLDKHTNVLHLAFFEKLRKWCSQRNQRIVRTVVYCNYDISDLHDSHHQSQLQNYGVETVHTSNQGKNYADLKIAIDVLTSMYSNDNIDDFFIMSNDKDMVPLLNSIRANKRNATVITTGELYNPMICEFADEHVSLERICEEEVEHKIIDTVADNYWHKFRTFVANQTEEYRRSGKFFHSRLSYVLRNEIKYSNIMAYELASIINDLYEHGDIFFYRTENLYGPYDYINFAPTGEQEKMLSLGLVAPQDIIPDFNMRREVDEAYEKAAGRGNMLDVGADTADA